MAATEKNPEFVLFRSFLSVEERQALTREALESHARHSPPSSSAAAVGEKAVNQTQETNNLSNSGCFLTPSDNGLLSTSDWETVQVSSNSLKLALGIRSGAGERLSASLPRSVAAAKRAFAQAAAVWREDLEKNQSLSSSARQEDSACRVPFVSSSMHVAAVLETLSRSDAPLTGLALLYGLKAHMKPHYDSPTNRQGRGTTPQSTQQHNQEEWLVMMSLGNSIRFQCQQQVLHISSGDVLVMNARTVLHGVESILSDDDDHDETNGAAEWERLGLPGPSRLGILLWQGCEQEDQVRATATREDVKDLIEKEEVLLDGVEGLFRCTDDTDDDE